KQFAEFFETLGNRFLAAGDFNAKHQLWGSRLINPKGRMLYNVIINKKMEAISQSMPTYWPTDRRKIPDIIDFGIIKGISKKYFKVETSPELSSDHSPLTINVSKRVIMEMQPCKLHNKKTNWQQFRELVVETLSTQLPLKDENDITQAVEYFNTNIQQAA
ncbi:Probable RNA-directed DNA polymerase from transposon X-element, partial [Harpegnathos saltator]